MTNNVEKIITDNQTKLKAFIRKRVPNKEDAEDVLQDVFFQLVKTVENTLNPIEQVSAWLFRVARNVIINKGKKKREEKLSVYIDDEGDIMQEFSEILFSEHNNSPETEYLRTLVWQELEITLAELPPEQREAFELTELEGLPVKEVAQTMNIPVNTLLSRKHYAVKHLRKRMEVLYNDIFES